MDKEDKIIMSKVLCRYAHGKRCVKCGAEATDIRIEYEAPPNATNEEREEAIFDLVFGLTDETKESLEDALRPTDKIQPYCYPCHMKDSVEDSMYEDVYVSYFGQGNKSLGCC